MMKKRYLLFSLAFILVACGTNNESTVIEQSFSSDKEELSSVIESNISSEIIKSESSSEELSTSIVDTKEQYLAKNYDFGDESTWAKDTITATDLGDCILDAYPYDAYYDWGQSIIYDSEDKVYKMWWCRQSGFDTIWYAESYDLKHWHDAQKILFVEQNSTWIKMHIGKPAVLKKDGKYIMYCEAPATLDEKYREFDNNVLMATSDDGIHFEYYTGDHDEPWPVISMSKEDMEGSWQHHLNGPTGYGYYGIGQPSVCYVDGTFYLYTTYSLYAGDRMYLFKSKDGINFDEGVEVFTRAGCGVKYNDLTGKFMLLYEQTIDRFSKVGYMESDDGVNFSYKDLTQASSNPNILTRNNGSTRGYADFVSDELGHINDYTIYCSFMEGKMADPGVDWRQYSSTWDIHISMLNLKEYGNREQVLPNGYVANSETLKDYETKHVPYEENLLPISKMNSPIVVDGNKDEIYDKMLHLNVDRQVFVDRAVPSTLSGIIDIGYDEQNLYLYIKVHDTTIDDDDMIRILFDEKRFAIDNREIVEVDIFRNSYSAYNLINDKLDDIRVVTKNIEDGYVAEVSIPWRYKKVFEKYDSFGFDCYIYNQVNSLNYKSSVSFNDVMQTYDIKKYGELYFSN